MNDLCKKIISKLKSNTYNSVHDNLLSKIPILIDGNGSNINTISVNGDTYYINNETGERCLDELELIIKDIIQSNKDPEVIAYLRTSILKWMSKICKIVNVKEFHYDDTWYVHKDSVDNPDESYGILRIDNMPFRSFNKLINKKSFICRMDQLVFNNLMEPFMIFIDGKFVNWNCIDIVFDCDDYYLILHGKKYTYYNLDNADIKIIILPFKVDFIGYESEYIWNNNYEMLKSYIQDSLHVNENNNIEINVPTMYSIYKKNRMVYNVGAWMYSQIKMYKLGMLSNDRINKLRRINVSKYIYNNGIVIDSYSTRFNALDRDSYDNKLYNSLFSHNLDYIKQRAIFKFNNDGILDMDNGDIIISNLDESMTVIQKSSSDENIIFNQSDISATLFKENYIIFKSGLLDTESDNDIYGNLLNIKNPNQDEYIINIFYPDMIEQMISLKDSFINKKYYYDKISNYLINKDNITKEFIIKSLMHLDYSYLNTLLYNQNYNNGMDSVIEFNPLLLNNIIDSDIKSVVIKGSEANSNITMVYDKSGLIIPRHKYYNHETYLMIFVNGELIESYNEMCISNNLFFIPIYNEFANDDSVELLFFTKCDNNEFHFNMNDNMISKLDMNYDLEFAKCDLFTEFMNKDDIKIFCEYPEEIIQYKELVENNSDISFNISKRNNNNELLLFKNVISNYDNKLTVVSSRRFIYERLYVDQKAYRIKLDNRFKYCDNVHQYMLFINGRRIDNELFFITVPKYTRPFWNSYIYISKFVFPDDRIEVFYVPQELYNVNKNYELFSFNENGYIEGNKKNIDIPMYNNAYIYFINGKKIPNNDIVEIDSSTVRVKSDTKTTNRLCISPIYNNANDKLVNYMHNNNISNHDSLIKYIKTKMPSGYDELDNLFKVFVKMSNIEDDINSDVGRIAILNEIIRDFWVASGYDYNKQPFIYDYELDEFIVKDYTNSNYILPSLDATPYINIPKNDVRLLYITTNKNTFTFEIGSKIYDLAFEWEFTNSISSGDIIINKQTINNIEIPNSDRKYIYNDLLCETKQFYFKFDTMQDTIEKIINIEFCNGIYYGTVDEDLLQHFTFDEVELDSTMAIIPKNKILPSTNELEVTHNNINTELKDNEIINNIYQIDTTESSSDQNNFDNIDGVGDYEYLGKNDLPRLITSLKCKYSDNPDLDFDKYVIGSNNYFVYACPKRVAYKDNKFNIKFIVPNINSKEILEYGVDDHTMPVYTDGNWDDKNCLNKLNEFKMIYIGEFEYTNLSGFTEPYMVWKSNGFFTRKYDDYQFDFKITSN